PGTSKRSNADMSHRLLCEANRQRPTALLVPYRARCALPLNRIRWPRLGHRRSDEMCDYSLHNVKTRPAKVSDKLTTRNFGTGTRGFSALEDHNVAGLVLPGTDMEFAGEVKITRRN